MDRLSNYHPFESDPKEYGRERFTGELNRLIWNNEEFQSAKLEGPSYAYNNWKSIDKLQDFFLEQAADAYRNKEFEKVIHYLNFVRAFLKNNQMFYCLDDWIVPGILVLFGLAWTQLGA